MKGYVKIPASIPVKNCKICGARPVIALAGGVRYVVKCPVNDSHYQTSPGVIDIEGWNFHNTSLYGD